jgi:hypothetical protein
MSELKPPFEVEFPDPNSGMSEGAEKRYDLGQINATEARTAGDTIKPKATETGSYTRSPGKGQITGNNKGDVERTGLNLHELEKADREPPKYFPSEQDILYGPK